MRAFITGITGQDGSYLAELLLTKGYEVFGLVRADVPEEYERIESILPRITLVKGDLRDQESLDAAVAELKPDELYNLAAQSFAAGSWERPVETADVNGIGVLRVLEAIRKHSPRTRFVQASSSEMFSKSGERLLNERATLAPRNPYGSAKAFAHNATISYRDCYGIFACSCIFFNHESPRRGLQFVTRKITHHAAAIELGVKDKLRLGNLDARRDWGYAGDYVRAMWLMLQQPAASDYVIATGETHSVREVLEIAFSHLGLDWHKHVEVDAAFVRHANDADLCGDSSKARAQLGWKPEVNFRRLIEMMVESDLAALRKQFAVRSAAAGA